MKSAVPSTVDGGPDADAAFQEAFHSEDLRERLRIGKLGCALVIVLMPLGAALDYVVYKDDAAVFQVFLGLRLLCSLVTGALLAVHYTRWGERNVRILGPFIALLPAVCIAGMIGHEGQWESHYYAGLNLVLIAVNVVARWTVRESLAIVGSVVAVYISACLIGSGWPEAAAQRQDLFNNLYFLTLTGVIVVAGNWLYNQLRAREFALRYELGKNQRQLQEANQKLRDLDEVKSRFFANISHELRTPLTLLLGPLDALVRQRGRLGEQEVDEHLETMHGNGLRLLKLINDLLDLVRLDSGHIAVRREAVPLSQFFGGVVNSTRKLAEDRRIQLRLVLDDQMGRAMLDPDKLEKVLFNLIINAIKFTASGGTITCHAERRGDEMVIEVSDSGVGIRSDDLPHIFDRFWQADTSSQRKHQGTGIGLALVKELVEAQGGHVTVASEVDKGTTFTIILPWIEPPRTDPHAQPVAVLPPAGPVEPQDAWLVSLYRRAELFPGIAPLKESLRPDTMSSTDPRPRVLIADDEPDMLRFLRSQLSGQFQVFEAVDGQQAIEKAAQFLPDIILSDMMMPEKDGLDVCREVRARFPTRNIPIVLLTARADDETKLAALTAGASDFLSKPFSTTELRVRLKNLVDAQRLQKELAWQNQKLQSTLEQLKETESQLVQSEKMASLGRMSAGIIHEINNPLNYAKTGIFTLQKMGRSMPPGEIADFEDILHDIGDGLTRVAGIVTDLRAFTHPHGGAMEDVDVRAVADGALRFLAAETKDVTVDNGIPPGFRVRANRNKLIQVFVNLLQNAVDALGEKRFSDGETARIVLGAEATDTARTVTFHDNGPGMDTDILGKIFDPFFTTKEVGKGTGLGLSICYRIINEAGGRIEARSEPGKWTEFALEFPTTV